MYFKIFLILVISLILPMFVYADNNGVWINASDVRGGEFGADETVGESNYIFSSDSNVGIGVDNPSFKLEVAGNISGDNIFINGNTVSTLSFANNEITLAKNEMDNYAQSKIDELDDNLRNWVNNEDYQKEVSQSCSSGSSIRKINSDGSVICQNDRYESVNSVDLNCNSGTYGSMSYCSFCVNGNCDST